MENIYYYLQVCIALNVCGNYEHFLKLLKIRQITFSIESSIDMLQHFTGDI